MKIPSDYLIDPADGKYYLWAADRFTMYALTELAGKDHTHYLDYICYFYERPDNAKRRKDGCTVETIFIYESISRFQVPLLPL